MGQQLDNLPDKTGADRGQLADSVLQNITRDLINLQQDLVAQLKGDVERLQTEKAHLLSDIEQLQNQHQLLKSEHQAALSHQQLAQQQVWAKQFAQTLAAHLQKLLSQHLTTLESIPPGLSGTHPGPSLPGSAPTSGRHDPYQLLAALDSTMSHTLKSLEQDLGSYQSHLSERLSRMQSLEQQGEALLETLVERLSHQLQSASRTVPNAAPTNSYPPDLGDRLAQGIAAAARLQSPDGSLSSDSPDPNPRSMAAPAPAPSPSRPPRSPSPQASSQTVASSLKRGILLIILSTIALSFHNVVVGLIGYGGRLFGQLPIEGVISFSISNSLLILWLRMLIVVPLMASIARYIYPPVGQDIRQLCQTGRWRLLWPVVGSGLFLFLSQVMIYTSIWQIGPGIAVTILFMYPLLTVPLAWLLFGDRPTGLRVLVMAAISMGVILAALPKLTVAGEISGLGIGTAVLSGIAFAFYLIFMQVSFRKLHPVPVSLIQFSTIFILTSVLLMLPFVPQPSIEPSRFGGLLLGGVVLGVLTLIGYLLNNFGVRLMGAGRASIIASSGPVLTAVLAFLITPGPMTALRPVQITGIILVTLGVAALSFERMAQSRKPS